MGYTKVHSNKLGQGALPNQTPPHKITEIQKLAKEGLSLSQIAKKTGVSRNTCKKYAEVVGVDFGANRNPGLKVAVENRTLDLKARRQALAIRLLDETDELLDSLHKEHLAFSFGGKDNDYAEKLIDAPPAADKKHIVSAASMLMQKHLEYIKHDNDNGASEAVSLISRIVDSLGIPAETDGKDAKD